MKTRIASLTCPRVGGHLLKQIEPIPVLRSGGEHWGSRSYLNDLERLWSMTTWNQTAMKRWIHFWELDVLVQICVCCEKPYRRWDTVSLPTEEWYSNTWALNTKWMKIQYIFFTSNVCQWDGNGNHALIENIAVLALKELCCLLNVGISQHLVIKDASSKKSVSYNVAAEK